MIDPELAIILIKNMKETFKNESDFKCQKCNSCCKKGMVTIPAIEALWILKEIKANKLLIRPNNHDGCVFLGKDGCQIHEFKPILCQVHGPINTHNDGINKVQALPWAYPGKCIKYNGTQENFLHKQLWESYLLLYVNGAVNLFQDKENFEAEKAITEKGMKSHTGKFYFNSKQQLSTEVFEPAGYKKFMELYFNSLKTGQLQNMVDELERRGMS